MPEFVGPVCYDVLYVLLCFFNEPATTDIYTLSLHDALPIYAVADQPDELRVRIISELAGDGRRRDRPGQPVAGPEDRKSTRLNSSHVRISYAVFCLKKK